MKLSMPADGDSTPVSSDKTVNLLLLKNNTISYYSGNDAQHFIITNFSTTGIRRIIQQKQKQVQQQFGDSKKMIVLIKPTIEASYKNIIDALDEMTINDVTSYYLFDASVGETSFFTKF